MSDKRPCVLCVDDQDVLQLKAVIERVFDGPIEVLTASDINEAQDVLADRAADIDVIVLDIFMPGGDPSGLDLGREVGADIPIIFVSGHPESSFGDKVQGLAPLAFHEKPVDPDKLIQQIGVAVAMKSSAAMLDPDLLYLKHICLSHVSATVVSIRFVLRSVHAHQAGTLRECAWDFAPLALSFRQLERCVFSCRGRIADIGGVSALAVFPAVGSSQDHFAEALQALRQTNEAIGSLLSKDFYCCKFSAGIVPGTLVMGVFGEQNPGHAAIAGRTVDVARQISYMAKPGEVGAVYDWLDRKERNTLNRLHVSMRTEPGAFREVMDSCDICYMTL